MPKPSTVADIFEQLRTHGTVPWGDEDKPAEEDKMADWTPQYEKWRHGGWYVTNVRYKSGACGCVSRNYDDGKWRIACGDFSQTFPSRDAAARAEKLIAGGGGE